MRHNPSGGYYPIIPCAVLSRFKREADYLKGKGWGRDFQTKGEAKTEA